MYCCPCTLVKLNSQIAAEDLAAHSMYQSAPRQLDLFLTLKGSFAPPGNLDRQLLIAKVHYSKLCLQLPVESTGFWASWFVLMVRRGRMKGWRL